jgi:hypothetical protein
MGAVTHLLALMRADAEEVGEVGSILEANKLWKVEAYMCVLMAVLLHGHKGFYLELVGLQKHLSKGRLGVVPQASTRAHCSPKRSAGTCPTSPFACW